MKVTRRQTIAGGTAVATLAAVPGWAQDTPPGTPSPSMLWYERPATDWVEALPVGNGRLGGMVFGGIASERIQLNEDTFFSGGPYDTNNPESAAALPEVRRLIFAGRYAEAQQLADAKLLGIPHRQMSYQPIGDLLMLFPGLENAQDYRRSLDLDGAITRTRFRTGSTTHVREVIASAVDQVVAIRLTAGGRGGVTAMIALASPQAAEVTRSSADTLMMSGIGPDAEGIAGRVRFASRVRLMHDGGALTRTGDTLSIRGAKEVLLLVATATSFRAPNDVSGDPEALTAATLARIGDKPWARILADHQADHRRLFRSCTIGLGTTAAAALPTDERIRRSAELDDPALAALYHQYGRYLLIASSRTGTQPANLQGIWNEKTNPSWQSKWTININTEMNYWPATMTGLGECVEPLLRMVKELSVTGRKTARDMYGARGWMVHNNTDVFRQTAVVDGAKWALWPTGAAWLLSNLWDHWDYSRDRTFLAEIYPLMTGACAFYLDTLQVHPRTGELVTNPSLSPENAHPFGASICAGPAMDSQLLRDLFDRTTHASELLGRDAGLRTRWRAARARLPKDRIGKAGQLQEWMDDWDTDAPEPHHRHVSHLYALYPSEQIDPETTPALAAAARRTLELRGDDATGWSLGWKLNLWAKLGDSEHAHKILRMLLEPRRTYPNMFDAHPPFQIDGNFGGTAGITQMLVQSHAGGVHLLPALPRAWPTGSIAGVRVRGGGVVDVRWNGGKLVEAVLRSERGGRFRVHHGAQRMAVSLRAGGTRRLRLDPDGRLVERA
ncbi:MAG: glycoside hydrolase family 95 protein [Pseudomonadota bacterium]